MSDAVVEEVEEQEESIWDELGRRVLAERIAGGDSRAALAALMAGDSLDGRVFG